MLHLDVTNKECLGKIQNIMSKIISWILFLRRVIFKSPGQA